MNIKNLSKDYLNTLPGLSEDEKEKIANFNANSDYVAFSAYSLRLNPGEMGWVDYDETGIRTWTDYGAPKRVDEQGYTLVDLAEYNPWYTSNDVLNQRKFEDGNYERRNLDGTNYRRSPDGFLEAWEAPKGRWEQLQHAIPYQVEANATWTKGGFFIKTDNLGESPLIDLLETVYCQVHQIERDDADFAGISMINFPEGSVGNLLPWAVKKQAYFKGTCRVAVLPRSENKRNKWWLTIKKSDLRTQHDPLENFAGTLNYFATDVRDKKTIKLFPSSASLIAEINFSNKVITDEKYNNYIEDHAPENNFIVKQFNEMREGFFNNYEQFRQKYPALVDGVNAKLNEPVIPDDTKKVDDKIWLGRKIKATDDEVTKNNLKKAGQKWIEGGGDIHIGKLLEAIDLMEELFEKASETPPPKQPSDKFKLAEFRQKTIIFIGSFLNQEPKVSSNDLTENNRSYKELINTAGNEDKINSIKDRLLADIIAKRKVKKQEQKIPEDTKTEGKTKEQLKEKLERVEESRGSQIYENNQVKVDNLKKELSKKISQEEYARIIVQVIEKILVKYKIGYDELDSEIKKQWEKLKSGEIKEFDRVSQVEKEVVNNAGNKGTRKKLDSLFRQAESALKTGKDIKKVKNRFNGFMSSNGIYEKSLLSQEAKKIESYLSQLENYSDTHSQSPSRDIPWTMIISIFAFFYSIRNRNNSSLKAKAEQKLLI